MKKSYKILIISGIIIAVIIGLIYTYNKNVKTDARGVFSSARQALDHYETEQSILFEFIDENFALRVNTTTNEDSVMYTPVKKKMFSWVATWKVHDYLALYEIINGYAYIYGRFKASEDIGYIRLTSVSNNIEPIKYSVYNDKNIAFLFKIDLNDTHSLGYRFTLFDKNDYIINANVDKSDKSSYEIMNYNKEDSFKIESGDDNFNTYSLAIDNIIDIAKSGDNKEIYYESLEEKLWGIEKYIGRSSCHLFIKDKDISLMQYVENYEISKVGNNIIYNEIKGYWRFEGTNHDVTNRLYNEISYIFKPDSETLEILNELVKY